MRDSATQEVSIVSVHRGVDRLWTRLKKRHRELLISSTLSPLFDLAVDPAAVDSNLPKVAQVIVGASLLVMPLLRNTNLHYQVSVSTDGQWRI